MQTPQQIFDNHGRPINYLRIAVTDRCNLRCFYCMPEEGIHYLPKSELLTYEEMLQFVKIVAPMGISKVRITGGEPFLRKDLMQFIEHLYAIEGINEIAITTNGVLTLPHIKNFAKVGIKSVNLSLDTMDRERFRRITRRDELPKVLETLEALLQYDIGLKINAVVMEGQNTEDILPLVAYTREHAVSMRFIEEMPFNGEGANYPQLTWDYVKIIEYIKSNFPAMTKIQDAAHSTALHYQVPGFRGNIGVIPAFSRTFCGTCNRIRLTAKGVLKTCLYDDGVLDLKALMRNGTSNEHIQEHLLQVLSRRPADGFEAENQRKIGTVKESMSTIGG